MRSAFLAGACALAACSFQVDGLVSGSIGDGSGPPSDGVGIAVDDMGGGDLAPVVPNPYLDVTSSPPSGPVDLTLTGDSDWAHWGFQAVTDFDHKASGNGQIATFSMIAGSMAPNQFGTNPTAFLWTDGLNGMGRHPTSGGNGNTGGVYTFGGGFRITAPAGPTPRRLIVHVALLASQAQMQIALSDGSAPAYSDNRWQRNDGQIQDVAYVIDYAAASAGQTVTVSWSEAQALGAFASVGLVAAALTKP
jgi:hypothetical protein